MWTSEESMTEYKKLTDEELIRRLRMGETGIIDYLMEKYRIWSEKKPMQCICSAERQTT